MEAPTAAPEAEDLVRRGEVVGEALRRLAPVSLEAHARLVHRDDRGRPIVAARHHAEWIRILEDRERYPWVCVVAPPGYAKSTFFSTIYPTWRVGVTAGRVRIGVVSSAAGQSAALVQTCGEAIKSPPFKAAYPGVEPDPKRGWSRGSFFVTGAPEGHTPTMLSSGLGGMSVLGKRFDEIVLDDPTTWEQARSRSVMEGQRHFLKTTLASRFPPGMGPPDGKGGRMVVVLTRWSEEDLVPTLADMGFQVVRMPALGYWDRLDLGDGEYEYGSAPLWPEKESLEQLTAMREEDELVFELVMQGNPAVLKGDFFDPDWFQRGELPDRERFERVVQYVDTAGGKSRRRGDYFVILTLGKVHGHDAYWVLDVYRARIPAPEQETAVIRHAARPDLAPDLVIVEGSNEGRALYQRLVTRARLPLKEYVPTKDKEFRATPVANAYRRGLVFHPERASWVRPFEAEVEAFPEGPHDDQVDALAGAYNAFDRGRPRVRVLG